MNFLCVFNIIVISLILCQDTAGSERFESVSTLYYRGAKAAIVCYGKTTILGSHNFKCFLSTVDLV